MGCRLWLDSYRAQSRENEMDKFPNPVTIDGKMRLVTVPGRPPPPKCFRCNSLGHMRSECAYSITSVNPSYGRRTYASAVDGYKAPPQAPSNSELTGGDGVSDSDPRQKGKQVGAEGGNLKSGPNCGSTSGRP